jgi:hypothetical protein
LAYRRLDLIFLLVIDNQEKKQIDSQLIELKAFLVVEQIRIAVMMSDIFWN